MNKIIAVIIIVIIFQACGTTSHCTTKAGNYNTVNR